MKKKLIIALTFIGLTASWFLICSLLATLATIMLLDIGFRGIDVPSLTQYPDRALGLILTASLVLAFLQTRRLSIAQRSSEKPARPDLFMDGAVKR